MIIKPLILVFITLIFINGCSSLNNSSLNSRPDSTTEKKAPDYLKDINAEITAEIAGKQSDNTPILLSSGGLPDFDKETEDKSDIDDVWLRLPELYQISDVHNKRIDIQKKWFLKHKKHLQDVSRRASPFLYFITEEVNKRKMPGEIALLPIIESSFRTNAYSRMKASGLWQFVPATGRSFGLKQNWWYDGRRDVYHSTVAALTYLQQLNKYYKGDWLLALAAYNAGARNINKAIKKNLKKGKPIDYWSLSLPKETYKYIPKLLAISQIVKNQQQLGVNLPPIKNSPHLMMVQTGSQIDLSVVAKMTNLSLKEIRTYNPGFKQWATDPDGPHHLFLPISQVEEFQKQLALLDEKDRVQWHRHKIRSGESLSVIAHKYKISVAVLKKSNHLKSSRIRAGKYLMVPSDSGQSIPVIAKTSSPKVSTSKISTANGRIYKVRSGDSFWKIAKKFGLSHKKLAAMNHLSSGDTLSIGQSLIISYQDPSQSSLARKSVEAKSTQKGIIKYKVKSGDSLYTISKQFKVTINDLKRWNQLDIKKYLKPGQELKVFVIASSQPI